MKKFLLVSFLLLSITAAFGVNYHSSDQLKTEPFCIVQTGTQSLNFVAFFEQNYAPPVIFCFQSKVFSQVPKTVINTYPVYIANIGYSQNQNRFSFNQSMKTNQNVAYIYALNRYRKNLLITNHIEHYLLL